MMLCGTLCYTMGYTKCMIIMTSIINKPWHFGSNSVPIPSQWDHLRREQTLTAGHHDTQSHGSVMRGTLQWLWNHQTQLPAQIQTLLMWKEPE